MNFPCSADHEQDWQQPCPVDLYYDVYVMTILYTFSTCPLHTNSRYEKREAHNNWSMVMQRQHRLLLKLLKDYWHCAGGLSAVNVIGTQLRDPINSGLA